MNRRPAPAPRARLHPLAALLLAAAGTAQAVDTFRNRNVPSECDSRMKSFVAAGHEIEFVAFPPAGGNRWTIVTDKSFFNRNVPSECHTQMTAFVNAGHKILCVAYPPAGGNSWTIVTDRTFFNRNVPAECHSQMIAFANAGHRILWVAYPPAGGNSWSIITDKSYFNRNVPSECHTKMGEFVTAGHKLRFVAFPPAGGNRWTIVSDRGYFNRATPSHLHDTMRSMARFPGGGIANVAYTPTVDGFTVVAGADPASVPGVIEVGAEYFSVDAFAANLKARILNKGVKGAFAIRLGNATRSFAYGAKRTSYSAPAQPFSIFDRFNPASVSKTVTAVAVLKAASIKGASIDDPIYRYLPTFWSIPSSVRTITIKELLNHTSGFRGTGFGYYYADLQKMVAQGISLANKVYDYENVNYALARIVCAYLAGYSEAGVRDHGKATADFFASFVQTNLMSPCGFTSVGWSPDSVEPTLWYPNPAGTSTGTTYGDWSLRPGSAGVNMSIGELVTFIDRVGESTSILSLARRLEMDSYLLGWDSKRAVKNGSYRSKGGYFPASYNGGAELHAYLGKFGYGLYVAAVTNGTISIDVAAAYDAAWRPIQPTLSQVTSQVENVTTGTITIRGQNLDVVNAVYFGSRRITSTDPTDPTAPYFRILGDTTIALHAPQPSVPGSYAIKVDTGLVQSNSLSTTSVLSGSPRLLVDTQPQAGQTYYAVVGKGPILAAQCWLAVSPVAQPSVFPGIVSLGIGANFTQLYLWPTSLAFDAQTAAVRQALPSVSSMAGVTLYYQVLYATRGLPLPAGEVRVATFQ